MEAHHLERAHEALGRPLTVDEQQGAASLAELNDATRAVARQLAERSLPLAAWYLGALVPGSRLDALRTFMTEIGIGLTPRRVG